MRWRIREGPIGSHQELAREEKWETSSAETDDVLCERVVGLCRRVVRPEVWLRHVDGLIVDDGDRVVRRSKGRSRNDAMLRD